MIRFIDRVRAVPDLFGRRWDEVAVADRCEDCGQPKSLGQGACDHVKISFEEVAQGGGKPGWGEYKAAFHAKYLRALRQVAKAMGLRRGEFEVSHNVAGPAVLGEVHLQTASLYVCVGGGVLERCRHHAPPGGEFFYRTCMGLRDTRDHGPNRWAPIALLDDPAQAAAFFNEFLRDLSRSDGRI